MLLFLLCLAPSQVNAQAVPVDIAVGSDNLTRLLWNNPNGSISLWRLDANGGVASQNSYGPYTGWSGKSLAAGTDGVSRILWTNTNGAVALWRVNGDGSFTNSDYGPYSGWNGLNVAVGGDNTSRILWSNTNGQMALWSVSADGAFTHMEYGPYTGYTAFRVAAGPNSIPRTLWNKNDGSISLWYSTTDMANFASLDYGPFAGYTPAALAVDSTNAPRIVWNHPSDRTVDLWKVTGNSVTNQTFSDPAGYSPVGLAAGTNGELRLLWSNGQGGAVVWTIAAGGTYTSKTYSVPVLTSITLSPASATLNVNGTQQFTATAKDQNGNALSPQPTFTWSVASGDVGSVSSGGLYSAGSSAGSATVKAVSGSVSGTAAVAVTAAATGPSLALVAAVNNQASLSWSSISGATSYNVKRSTTNGSGYTTIASVTDTSYTDQGLVNGTTYYYVVTAQSGTSEGAASNQVAATPTAQAFGFLNIGNGSVLSGELKLSVSMASKAYGGEASPVTFSVDGTVYDTGGDLQENSGNAGANTFFVLATDSLANGPHVLTVQDTNGNTASVNVTFSNVLYNISMPNMFDTSGGDGLPASAAITANLTSTQPWTVSIVTVDGASSVVQRFSGNSASINVSWNGKNSQGVEVDDDAYEVDISYGGGTQAAAKRNESLINPHGAPLITTSVRKNLLSKNKVGDCFIMLDQDVFPSGPDMIAYLKAIKADLAPSKGVVWNKFSFFLHSTLHQPKLTAVEIQRIDNHFRTPLTVFYVDSHGGIGTPNNGGAPFFRIGLHSWRADTFSNPDSSPMQTLTQSANYGINDPPALVFIDSCDSAPGSPSYPYKPILTFADDFDIGDGPSGFIGWDGFAVVYGDKPAPQDDWTFWRLDLWSQFTNVNQTYDTAYSKLQRDYDTHGHNWYGNDGYPNQVMVVNWLTGSSF